MHTDDFGWLKRCGRERFVRICKLAFGLLEIDFKRERMHVDDKRRIGQNLELFGFVHEFGQARDQIVMRICSQRAQALGQRSIDFLLFFTAPHTCQIDFSKHFDCIGQISMTSYFPPYLAGSNFLRIQT